MEIYLSLLICLAGAVIYGVFDGKPSALGYVMFGCGLLAFLLGAPGHLVGLIK